MAQDGKFGDWKRAARTLNPRGFQRRLNQAVARAHNRVGQYFVGQAVRAIREGKYLANRPVTLAFKKTTKPLVSGGTGGDLFKAITFDVDTRTNGLMVGLNRQTKSKDGKSVANIGAILHEGATIDVQQNPQVRRFVWWKLHQVAAGNMEGDQARAQEILDLAKQGGIQGKGVYVIKKRPFIQAIVEDKVFQARYKKELERAVQEAWNG